MTETIAYISQYILLHAKLNESYYSVRQLATADVHRFIFTNKGIECDKHMNSCTTSVKRKDGISQTYAAEQTVLTYQYSCSVVIRKYLSSCMDVGLIEIENYLKKVFP